jgi:asparagine synthase (glutamine-hydrolysing)
MSGIVGIINLDDKPVSRELLQQMTDFMAYRGPDGRGIWSKDYIGLGHTLLCTTQESLKEQQPFSLDKEVWITADARIDGRKELIGKLATTNLNDVTDVELILRAYDRWGEQCLEHLLGDFAFAIWDGRKRRLFCARDHFGVKPFYYAQAGNSLILSNTLNCVRLHPVVSNELNEQAIGDFLLFGLNQDLATTSSADIKRLPAAHYLTWSGGDARVIRYWTLPTKEIIYYKRPDEYIERFEELLREAVEDRLRTSRVCVSMSGGLDSTAIAAVAKASLAKQFRDFDLHACAIVYDRLIPDEERSYAGEAASSLGISIQYLAADDYIPYERWDEVAANRPEPYQYPLLALFADLLKRMAARSRVALTGWDGDTVLSESPKAYFASLLKQRRFGRLLSGMGWYALSQRRLPPVGFRTWLKRRLNKNPVVSSYPTWLNPSFAKRLNLIERWRQINDKPLPEDTVRPYAFRVFSSPYWDDLFKRYDAGVTAEPLEVRHPFADVRLVGYLLAIPPVPWCVKKELLKQAMSGILPESILRRSKSPLAADPVVEALRGRNTQWLTQFDPSPELAKYVDRHAISSVDGENDSDKLWVNIRPFSLNCWLRKRIGEKE